MKLTTLASLAAFTSIIASTTATALPDAAAAAEPIALAARKSLPFKLAVSSPHRQTLVAEYLLCNSHLTSVPANAAQYYFSDTPPFGVIYCTDNGDVSGKIGFSATSNDFAVLTPGDYQVAYFDRFSLGEDKKLAFSNKALGKAKWVLRNGKGGEQVDANFGDNGGFTTQDYIPVTLTAVF